MANRYWVGGSGTWDATSTANWSATSGGAPGASAPVAADLIFFDANSGTAATVSVAANAVGPSVTINKSDITLSLSGSPTFGSIILTTGIVSLNAETLTVTGAFASNNSNARTVNFGTGKIVLSGSGVVWSCGTTTGMVVSGTPLVEVTNSGAVATTVNSGSLTEAQSISFSFTAGSYALTLQSNSTYRNLSFSGFAGTVGSQAVTVFGDFTSGASTVFTATTNAITFAATSGPKTITSSGVTFDRPIIFNGVGGSWRLADALTIGSTRSVTLTNGTLDGNGNNASIGSFALGVGTKTLTLGSGTWTVVGSGTAWNANTNVANLTVSPSAGIISMTSASAKTFAGGALAWPRLNQGGSGALTIQQSNTFANITNTVQPATITLTAGTTQTVAAFGVSGTAGNLITLNSSTSGTRATLSDSIGTVEVSNVSIQDINATGGATWNAFLKTGNVDAGNNSGWDFFPAVRQVFGQVFSSIFRPIF